MPFANQHSGRVVDPAKFQEDSFRRKNIAPGVDIIIGKLYGEDTFTTQTYRFDAAKFTPEEAKKWLKDNNVKYISFETAVNSELAYDAAPRSFSNYHNARVIPPDKFEQDSFRTKEIAPGVLLVVGKLKGETSLSTHSYRFDASKFTTTVAKQWLKDNDFT